MSQADVEVLQRETCFKGFYRLDRLQLRHRQFAGGMGPQLSRELFVRHDAVCVLPYDPQRDSVVLIEQFRIGAMDKSSNPWLLELVAGLIDKDEQPEEVARREAVEEADLELTALWPITQYYPSPGGSDERVHLYIGRCDSEGADDQGCGGGPELVSAFGGARGVFASVGASQVTECQRGGDADADCDDQRGAHQAGATR